jgi:lauroyl/myristoyl acyltransferase/ADP-heptose:LPS heptosyltransferase
MLLLPARKRIVLSNLHHAFPNREASWYKKICRENFYRLMELGLLGVAGGFFSEKKIRNSFRITGQNRDTFNQIVGGENGTIVLLPHFTSMESMTLLPSIAEDVNLPDIGVIYRPFSNPHLEKFVKKTREKNGMKLISRQGGFFEAMKTLKMGGIVSILFDQSAGENGYRLLFFNRVVSSTDLPSLLHDKFGSPVYFMYPQRTGFWRAKIKIKRLKFDESDPKTILFAANKYLENILKSGDDTCADWLWAHDRWKVAISTNAELTKARRNWVAESRGYLNICRPIKNFRIVVRMPNWLGDVVMSTPLLRTFKTSMEEAQLILVCQQQFVDFLEALHIADRVVRLPEKKFSYFFNLSEIENLYPDVHISLVNSLRGDLEALIVGAPTRIGIDTKNRTYRKFFINNLYKNYADAGSVHQTKLWQKMLNEFRFPIEANFAPFKFCIDIKNKPKYGYSIGLVCGSLNEPRRRWPMEYWKILIERIFEKYQGVHINLYGTKTDAVLTNEIVSFFNRAALSNLAGATSVLELADYMQRDDLIISIDSGGMHLANMFGCPLICLFGITNPIATGPIFNATAKIVMPSSAPAKGGFPIADIEVDSVFKAIQTMLK